MMNSNIFDIFSLYRYPIDINGEINANTANRIRQQVKREIKENITAQIPHEYRVKIYEYQSIEGLPFHWHYILRSPSGVIHDFPAIYANRHVQLTWPLPPDGSCLYSLPDLFYYAGTDRPIRVVANEDQVHRLKKGFYRNVQYPPVTTAGFLRPLDNVDWDPVAGRRIEIDLRNFHENAHAGFDGRTLADYLKSVYACDVTIL